MFIRTWVFTSIANKYFNVLCIHSGVIKRQGSPPHPLSGFIQAQITHSQKIQGLQPAAHVPGYPQQHPVQPTQVHPPAQDRFSGFQHGQGQTPVLAGSQVHIN